MLSDVVHVVIVCYTSQEQEEWFNLKQDRLVVMGVETVEEEEEAKVSCFIKIETYKA